MRKLIWMCTLITVLCLLLAGTVMAQERITIQAYAWGTSTQMGHQLPVKIIIEQLSTAEDQKTLLDAFNRSGHQGVLEALQRMKPKGRIALEGTVGNDVKYIIELPSEKGRRFRLITDRNIAFGELYRGTRSQEYSIGGAEIILLPGDEGSGTLLPACKLKLNKQQQIEIEAFQNPWELKNFIINFGG